MNGTAKLFLIVFIGLMLVANVLLVIRNKTSVQEKQKREEQKQSIIKAHYVVRIAIIIDSILSFLTT